ncbi:6793_t:CDS:1, partial [Paraglomus occultum]
HHGININIGLTEIAFLTTANMVLSQLLSDYTPLILLVLFVIVIRKLQKFLSWRKIGDDLPGPPASLLTGNVLEIGPAGGMGLFLRNLHETYGPVVRYWIGPSGLFVSINDADILDQLALVNAERPTAFIEFMKEVFNDKSLFYLSGAKAKERRLIYHKVFAKRPYENIMPQFSELVDELGSKWLSQRNGDKS